ncbi:hypothetical protein [Chitinophaga silvisoli]|uniref:Uncharacterized protein n=1 Tax=Chitinophaga silvisoli TaxID=2291814 RepID=A0A3E1P1T2_9BACT|nr:hypothetical protein [Chitinophaga silvisoli]RFM33948.1 hypothetical protein DXN04_18535 [Chitinophaga silvisoli]
MEESLTAPVIIHSTFDLISTSEKVINISNDIPFVSTAFLTSPDGKRLLSVKAIIGLNADSMESFRLIVTEVSETLGVTLRYDQDVDSTQRSLWYADAVFGNIDQIEKVEFMVDSSDDYHDPKPGRIALPKE